MSNIDYLSIVKRMIIRGRSILRESPRTFKIYLPSEYNDLWEVLKSRGVLVDAIVILPRQFQWVDKIVSKGRSLVREGGRFKLYLPKGFNDVWESLRRGGEKVDLLIVFNI